METTTDVARITAERDELRRLLDSREPMTPEQVEKVREALIDAEELGRGVPDGHTAGCYRLMAEWTAERPDKAARDIPCFCWAALEEDARAALKLLPPSAPVPPSGAGPASGGAGEEGGPRPHVGKGSVEPPPSSSAPALGPRSETRPEDDGASEWPALNGAPPCRRQPWCGLAANHAGDCDGPAAPEKDIRFRWGASTLRLFARATGIGVEVLNHRGESTEHWFKINYSDGSAERLRAFVTELVEREAAPAAAEKTQGPDEPLRMDAYYYSFKPTGVREIDLILSAVACAGKSYHHTESWNEEACEREGLSGTSPIEWIQNAANEAARARSAVTPQQIHDATLVIQAMEESASAVDEWFHKDERADQHTCEWAAMRVRFLRNNPDYVEAVIRRAAEREAAFLAEDRAALAEEKPR